MAFIKIKIKILKKTKNKIGVLLFEKVKKKEVKGWKQLQETNKKWNNIVHWQQQIKN